MAYYIFFSILFVLSMFEVFLKPVYIKKLSCITLFIISIFIGTRYQLGVDWLFYHDFYISSDSTKLLIEPGYLYLNNLFYFFCIPFDIFITLISIAGVIIVFLFFSQLSPYPSFCLFIYYLVSIGFAFEAIRQGLALSIILISFTYYLNGNKKIFYIMVLLASFFHVSALIVLIIAKLAKANSLRKYGLFLVYLWLFFVFINVSLINIMQKVIIFYFDSGFSVKVLHYLSEAKGNNALTLGLLAKIFIITLIYNFRKKIIYHTSHWISIEKFNILFGILLIYILLNVIFSDTGTLISRLSVYFVPVYILFFSYVLVSREVILERFILMIILSIISFSSFYRFTTNDYFIKQYLPYRSLIIEKMQPNNNQDLERKKSVVLHWDSKRSDN